MRIFSVFFLLLFFNASNSQPFKIEQKKHGEFFLSIYLPAGYDSMRGCKVLYFNDGQTIFGRQGLDIENSMNGLLNSKLVEPIIIVGIHSDQSRNSNYIPYRDESMQQDFGDYNPDARKYTQKIIKKLIPFINRNYKTLPGYGIAGFSFGGLHATWAALNYPETFSYSAALSPSYWVNDFEIFKEAVKARTSQTYYFDIGTGEWNYYVPMLVHSRLPILRNVFYYEDPGAQHNVESWRGKRIQNLLLLFAGKTDTASYEWNCKIDVIRSQHSEKFYLRLNPVITYSNGLTCSISYAARFTLLNSGDGVINRDGSFNFVRPTDLHVKVSYNGQEKNVLIKHSEVNQLMKR